MTVALSSKMSGKTHDEEDVDVGTPGAPGVLVGYVGDALAAARSELDYCHGQEVRVPRETAISGQLVECWIGGSHCARRSQSCCAARVGGACRRIAD